LQPCNVIHVARGFSQALTIGEYMAKDVGFSYEEEAGRWWIERSDNAVHRRAYANVADFIKASFTRHPGLIVDYACGQGNLLALLCDRFSKSKLVGLDGSSLLLDLAAQRIARLSPAEAKRISLIKTRLPNMSILKGKAELAIFCFPNMMPYSSEDVLEYAELLSEKDHQIANKLAATEDMNLREADAATKVLMQARAISLNLRRILKQGGMCARIEYASMKRHELSPDELSMVCFEEGSLDQKIDGKLSKQLFRLRASAYFRSRVLEDVYEQTGDERDRNGGYIITILEAI